jgi:hypothetical protein
MTLSRTRQLAHLAGGFRKFLSKPVTLEAATEDLRQRLQERESNFVRCAKRLIYDVLSSPYRRLLLWAGCEYGDLCASVKSRGLEKTLESLRDQGVYLSLEEFKSRVPVLRTGLSFETYEVDFDNPLLLGGRITGETSGSKGKASRVNYDWDFLAEEASHEAVLYATHGVLDAPLALWFPIPPGIAGIHNLLMSLKHGQVAEKWFSQSHCGLFETSLETRLALEFLFWRGRSAGLAMPRPSFADLTSNEVVVRWMESAIRRNGRAVVRTFGSSAVRMTETALAIGTDLRGGRIFAGGEPLTEPRRRFMESAGLEVYPRYVSTESGLVAASCPHRRTTDDMHFYSDRMAVIRLDRGSLSLAERAKTLLFTSLTLHTAKVMLNVELGDLGEVTNTSCSCAFGQLGFNVHLAAVRSYEKLTVEGMTVLTAELESIIGAEVEKAGGQPDSYQFWEAPDPSGLHRLIISVSPEVPALDESKLIDGVITALRRDGPRKAMAAEFWGQAASFQVIREYPQSSRGHKMHALTRRDKHV